MLPSRPRGGSTACLCSGSNGSGADPLAVVERIHATAYAAAHATAGSINVDQPLHVGPFTSFVQQLAPALKGPHFVRAFEPFAASIGVETLAEPERGRVLATQRIDQQLVLVLNGRPGCIRR